MFGLDDAEVQRRRRYVGDARKEIQVRSISSSHLKETWLNSKCKLRT